MHVQLQKSQLGSEIVLAQRGGRGHDKDMLKLFATLVVLFSCSSVRAEDVVLEHVIFFETLQSTNTSTGATWTHRELTACMVSNIPGVFDHAGIAVAKCPKANYVHTCILRAEGTESFVTTFFTDAKSVDRFGEDWEMCLENHGEWK